MKNINKVAKVTAIYFSTLATICEVLDCAVKDIIRISKRLFVELK